MKNKNLIIIGVIALLIGGAIGFFAGTKYQQGQTQSRFTQFANGGPNGTFTRGNGGRFGNGNGGTNTMAVRGQIISSDNNSITVKMQDGSTKIVILGSSATIAKTETGSASDLTSGAEVTVFGTTNSDGTVTAENVQVGNIGMFGPRGGASPSASPAAM